MKAKAKRPFGPVYPQYEGERGSPEQWRAAFADRMGIAEATDILHDRSARGILGLAADCDWPAVKKAYRKLAMQHHPDHGGTAEAFRDITAAYVILEDEHERGQI